MAKPNSYNPSDYPLLRDVKKNQFITRVDRWSIQRYYDTDDGKRETEMLFYPSEFGFAQIQGMEDDVIMSDKAAAFKLRLDRLILNGDARWEL